MAQPDTKELDALLDSLNGSAERFQTLWFSFLGLTLYLAIAALATTHRMLLLGEPQTLPDPQHQGRATAFLYHRAAALSRLSFLSVDDAAAARAHRGAVREELRKTLPDEADQERYRARVENALFLQLLVGMKDERAGFNSLLLAPIALITFVLSPLATLILMQMMFLPYHSLRSPGGTGRSSSPTSADHLYVGRFLYL